MDYSEYFLTACSHGDTEIIKLLFSSDLDINYNKQDNSGDTGFIRACINGYTEVVKVLVNSEKKIDYNKYDETYS